MKTTFKVLCILLLTSLMTPGCTFPEVMGGKRIIPSETIISETREASGFSGVDMGTFGKVILSQGEVESVTVSGSDNLVALVETNVRNGILHIEPKEEFYLTPSDKGSGLTFIIEGREIDSVTISGIGELEMERLTAPELTVTVNGGGNVLIRHLITDDLTIVLSGLGNVTISGEAKQANITLSGAGDVNSPDLKIQTANVELSGMGGAKLWVTDQLTGEISGAGGVSYHGGPRIDVKTTGLGEFKALDPK